MPVYDGAKFLGVIQLNETKVNPDPQTAIVLAVALLSRKPLKKLFVTSDNSVALETQLKVGSTLHPYTLETDAPAEINEPNFNKQLRRGFIIKHQYYWKA